MKTALTVTLAIMVMCLCALAHTFASGIGFAFVAWFTLWVIRLREGANVA